MFTPVLQTSAGVGGSLYIVRSKPIPVKSLVSSCTALVPYGTFYSTIFFF